MAVFSRSEDKVRRRTTKLTGSNPSPNPWRNWPRTNSGKIVARADTLPPRTTIVVIASKVGRAPYTSAIRPAIGVTRTVLNVRATDASAPTSAVTPKSLCIRGSAGTMMLSSAATAAISRVRLAIVATGRG